MSEEYKNAEACAERMAAGANSLDIPECGKAALGYAKAAKVCVDEGWDSSNCQQELVTEAAKGAAVAYGVDPSVVDAAEECLSSGGDSEICAKAGAKLAATAGCMVVTEGAGGPICAKLAPFVVDAVWPLAGPPLVATWDIAYGFAEGLLGGLASFAQAILDVAGIDLSTDADPTVMGIYWDLLGLGRKTLLEQWEVAVEAVQTAQDESRRELGLPIPLPIIDGETVLLPGSISDPAQVSGEASAAKFRREAVEELERWLRLEPAFTDQIHVIVRYDDGPFAKPRYEVSFEPVMNKDLGPYDKRVRFGGMDPNMKKMTVGTPRSMEGTYEIEEGEGWTPWGYTYDRFKNERKTLAEAYLAGIAFRLEGIKNATTTAVGSVVSTNVAQANKQQRDYFAQRIGFKEPEGSLAAPLTAAALLVGGLVGYHYWKKSKAST